MKVHLSIDLEHGKSNLQKVLQFRSMATVTFMYIGRYPAVQKIPVSPR